MNRAVLACDTIALIGSVSALLILPKSRGVPFKKDINLILSGIIVLFVFHDFSNVLQWSGISLYLDTYEGYIEILTPVMWGMFFYAYLGYLFDQELHHSKERFRALVETTSDWIWEFNSAGVFSYTNPKVKEILGYQPHEVIGKSTADFLPSDYRQPALKTLAVAISREEAFTGQEIILQHKDGDAVILEISGIPFFDERGTLMGYRGVNRNITNRKQSELALKKAKQDLEQQNKELKKLDKIKDGLIRDVTHELKTPVAKISMQLELLREFLESKGLLAENQHFFEVIADSIKRQDNVIRQILDLSRLEAGGRKFKREEVKIDGVIEEIIADYRHNLDVHGFEIQSALDPVTIRSDREMLWHVFSNIINNAIKYRSPSLPPKLIITLSEKDSVVMVTFTDNGIGLTEEETSKVFDRFYQAEASFEGCGVGLTIARMIVENLGGTIKLESPGKGKGTTVFISL